MQDLIWVKAGYTLGYYFPELSEFEIDQTDEDDLQKNVLTEFGISPRQIW
jgi:hypothetical protein